MRRGLCEPDWCPYQRDPTKLARPCHHVRLQRKDKLVGGGFSPDPESASAVNSANPASRTGRCLLLLSHLVYSIFVIKVQMD